MAQKKAFVRYAANKAVPGSLIVRTKAPKVGTWKEVPYDLCCEPPACGEINMRVELYRYSGPDCVGFISQDEYFIFACNGQFKIGTATTPSLPVPDGYYNGSWGFNVYVENSIAVTSTPVCA